MDGQRFDNLARKIAASSTRRGFFRALAGGLAGTVAARFAGGEPQSAEAACAASGRACTADGECCAGLICGNKICRPGCRISGHAYAAGAHHPTKPCLACRPNKSTTAWKPLNDGTACDDGDPCTTGDVCKAGVCKPGKPKCGKCNTCDPATGTCTPVPDNTRCDDGNACTLLDYCVSGVCYPGEPIHCIPQICHASKCDPKTGQCVARTLRDDTPCKATPEDALYVIQGKCDDGTCVANPKVCKPCHHCDPAHGCVSDPNGTPCDTGDPCQTGTCHAGICKGQPKDCGTCRTC